MIQELPGDPADQMTDCLDFWKRYYQTMPALAKLARVCITIAPSSASVERVFSILKSTFSVNQMWSSLEDYTALSVMLQSNKKLELPLITSDLKLIYSYVFFIHNFIRLCGRRMVL